MNGWKEGRKEGRRKKRKKEGKRKERGRERGEKEGKKRDIFSPRAIKNLTSVCVENCDGTAERNATLNIFKSLILLYLKFKNGMSRDFQQSM